MEPASKGDAMTTIPGNAVHHDRADAVRDALTRGRFVFYALLLAAAIVLALAARETVSGASAPASGHASAQDDRPLVVPER